MNLFLDFESRSVISLNKTTAWVYAADPSTEATCCAFALDDKPVQFWLPESMPQPMQRMARRASAEDLLRAVAKADCIWTWNAQFDWLLWRNTAIRQRWDVDLWPVDRLRDIMALAAQCSLPKRLGACAKALGLDIGKDEAGGQLMKKLCRPKPAKRGAQSVSWHDDVGQHMRLCEYCMQDVEVARKIWRMLPPLDAMELSLWRHTLEVNNRGVQVDMELRHALDSLAAEESDRVAIEFQRLTGTDASVDTMSPKQITTFVRWLAGRGLQLPSLAKDEVEMALLRSDLSPEVRKALELRVRASHASTAKLAASARLVSTDNRMRGMLMYHGASTGRWTGKGFQLQNLPRGEGLDPDVLASAYQSGGIETVDLLYPDVSRAVSSCIRGVLVPKAGHTFLVGDFSAIEGRLLAWFAGEREVLDAYAKGLNVYKMSASAIYGVEPEKIDKSQRLIGKVAELALGYQGGQGAFSRFAAGYGLDLESVDSSDIIAKWRGRRLKTVRLWHELDQAAKSAIKFAPCGLGGKVQFRMHASESGNFLVMRIPSGRLLWYYKPTLEPGKFGEQICYWGEDSQTKSWRQEPTYGGKLAENLVSATARDVLAAALLRLERAGMRVVFHVHDEVICEVPNAAADVEKFTALMEQLPDWLDCLMKVEAWSGKRYRK